MSQLSEKLTVPSRLRVNWAGGQWAPPGIRWANADILASDASSTQSCMPGPAGAVPSMVIVCSHSPGLRCGIWLSVRGPDAAADPAPAPGAAPFVGAGLLQAESATRATPVRAAAIEARMDLSSG